MIYIDKENKMYKYIGLQFDSVSQEAMYGIYYYKGKFGLVCVQDFDMVGYTAENFLKLKESDDGIFFYNKELAKKCLNELIKRPFIHSEYQIPNYKAIFK